MSRPKTRPARVAVFTASGTFAGEQGTVQHRASGGAYVLLDGAEHPMFFRDREIVWLEEPPHAGAE